MRFAEWHRSEPPIDDDECEAPDLGAEILDSSIEYVGEVGGDPFGGAWPMNVND